MILQLFSIEKVKLYVYKISVIVWTPPPPPHYKGGGIDFIKFGNKDGDEIFFLDREGLD